MKGHGRFAVAATIFLLWSAAALGATRTWTGASSSITPPGNNFWGNALNWDGGVLPVAGDDLVFNAGTQNSSINTFNDGTTFNSITINNHAIGGQPIALNAFLSGTGALISLQITLNASQTFTATAAGSGLTFNAPIVTNGNTLTLDGPGGFVLVGVISGSGGITKDGSGSLQFAGNHSYTGDTTILDGPVRIAGDHSGSRFVTFDGFDGLIGGVGTVKGLTASDPIDPGAANNGTGILASVAGLDITTNGSLQIDIKGTGATPQMQFDQVQVTGTVEIDNISGLFGAGLNVELVGFTPAPGDSFVIITNDGTDPITNGAGSSVGFFARPEGATFTVPNSSGGNTTFFITYKGGDGNDVVLHVPATRTWDGGGGDNKWSTAANWVDDVVPAVGDDLVFPAGAAQLTNTNDLPAGTLFNSITVAAANYFLSGNAITLRAGIISSAPNGNISMQFDSITLAADQSIMQNGFATFFVSSPIFTNGKRLSLLANVQPIPTVVLTGIISGTGGVTLGGNVFCRLEGGPPFPRTNSYTGATILTDGILVVRALQPASPVQISGGRLTGKSQVGAITATGGSIRPSDGVPGVLKIAGNLSMSGGAILQTELTNTTPVFGQLEVTGTVSLGGAVLDFRDQLPMNNPPTVGDKFVIIVNDGNDPVSGTFNSLPEGGMFTSNNHLYSISYQGGDGNDVAVEVVSLRATTALGNISTRLPVQTGDNVLIGGFIVTGTGSKKVLIRALGPSLPLGGTLQDPVLELHNGTSPSPIFTNNNWKDTQQSQIEETTIPPSNDLEAAIVATLPANNSAYTAIVKGANNGTGIGLVEIYDISPPSDIELANISTRGFVQTGDNILIAGTIIVGEGTQRVLVRAIGPSLSLANKMADPTLELRDGNGALIEANDNWKDSPKMQEIMDTTIPPSNDLESAIVATVTGNNASYTAIVRGVNNATGIAVVEVYALP